MAEKRDEIAVVQVSKKIKPQTNRYYGRVAVLYRLAAVVLGTLLVLFTMALMVVGRDYITYDNLAYLAKDFDMSVRSEGTAVSVVQYDRHENLLFAPYKNGMTVAGGESITIYDGGGIVLLRETLSYDTPCLAVSDKYVLAYDLGGRSYSIYNTLTRVINRQTTFKITAADVSDDGAFLLVTRSNDTKYVVELYNSALNHTMSVYKDNYVMDAAIRKDGDRFVICSAYPTETRLNCEVSLCAAGKKEPVTTVTFAGLMPLCAAFGPQGDFTVLCDTAVLFFDKNGELVNRYNISGMTLVSADMRDGRTALIGAENALGSENRVVVLDSDGSLLLEQTYRERMQKICLDRKKSDTLCTVLTPGSLLQMDAGGIVRSVSMEDDDILTIVQAYHGVMLCTKDCMYTAVFSEENGGEI